MGKPTISIGENKGADQLRSNFEADQRLCFRYTDSTIPPLLIPKFRASSLILRLYSPVCVGPGRNPNCWFSHAHAQIFFAYFGKTAEIETHEIKLLSSSVASFGRRNAK